MTRDEFQKEQRGLNDYFVDNPESVYLKRKGEQHEVYVKRALQQGKPVPPEVLKDYPELKTETLDDYTIRYIASQTKGKSPEDKMYFYVNNLVFKNKNYLPHLIEKYKLPKNDFLKIDAKIQELAERSKPQPSAETKAEPVSHPSKKRETAMDRIMNQVTLYGGIPVRYGTMIQDMDNKAKEADPKNWFKIREAGLMGHDQAERLHPYKFPDDVEPLTLKEFETLTNLKSGEKVPDEIHRKWITMYPKEERYRFEESKGPNNSIANLERKESSRSKLSRIMDERQPHSITIDKNDPRVKLWLKDQGRADIRGIDTPRIKPPKLSSPKRKAPPPQPSFKRGKMRAIKTGGKVGFTRRIKI